MFTRSIRRTLCIRNKRCKIYCVPCSVLARLASLLIPLGTFYQEGGSCTSARHATTRTNYVHACLPRREHHNAAAVYSARFADSSAYGSPAGGGRGEATAPTHIAPGASQGLEYGMCDS